MPEKGLETPPAPAASKETVSKTPTPEGQATDTKDKTPKGFGRVFALAKRFIPKGNTEKPEAAVAEIAGPDYKNLAEDPGQPATEVVDKNKSLAQPANPPSDGKSKDTPGDLLGALGNDIAVEDLQPERDPDKSQKDWDDVKKLGKSKDMTPAAYRDLADRLPGMESDQIFLALKTVGAPEGTKITIAGKEMPLDNPYPTGTEDGNLYKEVNTAMLDNPDPKTRQAISEAVAKQLLIKADAKEKYGKKAPTSGETTVPTPVESPVTTTTATASVETPASPATVAVPEDISRPWTNEEFRAFGNQEQQKTADRDKRIAAENASSEARTAAQTRLDEDALQRGIIENNAHGGDPAVNRYLNNMAGTDTGVGDAARARLDGSSDRTETYTQAEASISRPAEQSTPRTETPLAAAPSPEAPAVSTQREQPAPAPEPQVSATTEQSKANDEWQKRYGLTPEQAQRLAIREDQLHNLTPDEFDQKYPHLARGTGIAAEMQRAQASPAPEAPDPRIAAKLPGLTEQGFQGSQAEAIAKKQIEDEDTARLKKLSEQGFQGSQAEAIAKKQIIEENKATIPPAEAPVAEVQPPAAEPAPPAAEAPAQPPEGNPEAPKAAEILAPEQQKLVDMGTIGSALATATPEDFSRTITDIIANPDPDTASRVANGIKALRSGEDTDLQAILQSTEPQNPESNSNTPKTDNEQNKTPEQLQKEQQLKTMAEIGAAMQKMDIPLDQQEAALRLVAQNPEGAKNMNDLLKTIAPKEGEPASSEQQGNKQEPAPSEQQANVQKTALEQKIKDLTDKGEENLSDDEKKNLSWWKILLGMLAIPALVTLAATTSAMEIQGK